MTRPNASPVILEAVDEISLDELADLWRHHEAAVDLTPAIDPWCSGPDWQLPVARGFAPKARRLLLVSPAGDGFVLLGRYRAADGTPMLGGIEPLWGFGSPIVGADVGAVAAAAAMVLAGRRDWRVLFLPGIPPVGEGPAGVPARPGASGGQARSETVAVALALSSLGRVGFGEGITRRIADLTGGYEAWLSRRSPRFRRNLRQAAARAAETGLTICDASTDPDLFQRLLAIERRSWKGHRHSGITSPEMTTTYRLMVERLSTRDRLQAHIARVGERDVGYILGGIRGRRYRGLQLSYDDEARQLSIGNLLQDHQLRHLDRHGLADVYDLGMDIDYKRRWSDRTETTVTMLVHRA